jgi:hypothetical protein
MLCSLDQFKSRYGFAGEADDAAIEQVIRGASAEVVRAMGRTWGGRLVLEEARRTFVLSAESMTRYLWLPAYPVSVIHTLTEGLDGVFEAGDELEEGEDFTLDQGAGTVLKVGGFWPFGERSVEIDCTGGYTPPDEATLDDYEPWAAGEYAAGARVSEADCYWECIEAHTAATAFDATKFHEDFLLPDDLQEAGLEHAGAKWQARGRLGLTSGSAGQGGSFSASDQQFLPAVKAAIEKYRRLG